MPATDPRRDRVYENGRREAVWIVLIWIVFAVWVVGGSALLAYATAESDLRTVLGMPAWVFWGVGLPWLASTVVTIWFSFFVMSDDPLGDEEDVRA